MSKFARLGTSIVEQDGSNSLVIVDFRTPEQAARIVQLLNEGEADKRRLDWLEGNGSNRLDVSTDGNPLERNDGSNPLERWPWRRITWREAINRAIASESEPAGRKSK